MPSASAPQLYIIEADPSVSVALARLARAARFEATTFQSVEVFLRTDARLERACVISEVRLPGISGLALPELLAEAGKKLPVVIITGEGDSGLRQRALHAGAVAFLSKPADEEDLFSAIADALTSESARSEA